MILCLPYYPLDSLRTIPQECSAGKIILLGRGFALLERTGIVLAEKTRLIERLEHHVWK